MKHDDYGPYGKGTTGYVHYRQAMEESKKSKHTSMSGVSGMSGMGIFGVFIGCAMMIILGTGITLAIISENDPDMNNVQRVLCALGSLFMYWLYFTDVWPEWKWYIWVEIILNAIILFLHFHPLI